MTMKRRKTVEHI